MESFLALATNAQVLTTTTSAPAGSVDQLVAADLPAVRRSRRSRPRCGRSRGSPDSPECGDVGADCPGVAADRSATDRRTRRTLAHPSRRRTPKPESTRALGPVRARIRADGRSARPLSLVAVTVDDSHRAGGASGEGRPTSGGSRSWSTPTPGRSCWRRRWPTCSRTSPSSGWRSRRRGRRRLRCAARAVGGPRRDPHGGHRPGGAPARRRAGGVRARSSNRPDDLGLHRLFVLTFEVRVLPVAGVRADRGAGPVPGGVRGAALVLRPGVAEFLDLPYVKPNTLGNTRMLKIL